MNVSSRDYVQPVIEWTQTNGKPPLRIALLVGRDKGLAGWELQLLDRLMADPRFALVALLIHPRAYTARPTALFRMVASVDRRLFARLPPYRPTYIGDIRERIERIQLLEPQPSGEAELTDEVMERLCLDLVLRTIPAGLADRTVAALPFGEWAANIADLQSGPSEWCGFCEVVNHEPSIKLSIRVRRGEKNAVEEIDSAHFNPKFSAARSAAFLKEKSVFLTMRELRRLADTRQLETRPIDAGSVSPPRNREIGRYIAGFTRAAAARARTEIMNRAGRETAIWTLYSGEGNIEDFEPDQSSELPPARNSIKADPFLFHHNGHHFVFYENYALGDTKAHIAVGRLKQGAIMPLGKALESDVHLSFPFVFRSKGQIYMMPETHQHRRVEIWRCVKFPLQWELHATAMEGCSVADSTLFRHRNKWWLLTNLSDYHAFEDHCSELYAFEVDGPDLSRVEPHRRNPVVIGSDVARNAGRVFSRAGRLFRPSQNNSYGIYGYGLNIMEIDELTPETYREHCIRRILPDSKPGLIGCHHFDASNGRYILDARLNS